MKIFTSDLWVARCASGGGYGSYDNEAPDAVFTSREEAETYCAEMKAAWSEDPMLKSVANKWRVESLDDTFWRLREENYDRGAADADSNKW